MTQTTRITKLSGRTSFESTLLLALSAGCLCALPSLLHSAQPAGLTSAKNLVAQLSCRGEFFEVAGRPAFLLLPKGEPAVSPMPWVWYAPTLDGHPDPSHIWMFRQFLEKGIAIAGVDIGESYGNPQGRKVCTALADTLRKEHGMSERACLLPQSRGGLMLYNWAVENPRRVACIAGIYTVCDLRSYPGLKNACGAYGMNETQLAEHLAEHNPVDRLEPLAKAKVPILHVHGDSDTVVPIELNSGKVAERYRQLGGKMRLITIRGKGHEVVPEFFHCQEYVDFIISHAIPSSPSVPEANR